MNAKQNKHLACETRCVTTLNPCHGGRGRARRGERDLRQDLRRLSLMSLNLSWRRRWRAWRRWISLWSCTRRRWSSWGTRCVREGGQAQSLNRTKRTLSEAIYCASSGPQHVPGNISSERRYFVVLNTCRMIYNIQIIH